MKWSKVFAKSASVSRSLDRGRCREIDPYGVYGE